MTSPGNRRMFAHGLRRGSRLLTVIASGFLPMTATAAAIVERLNRKFVRIVNLPDVRAKLVAMGSDIVGNTSEAFAAEIRADVARWGPIMEAADIRRE